MRVRACAVRVRACVCVRACVSGISGNQIAGAPWFAIAASYVVAVPRSRQPKDPKTHKPHNLVPLYHPRTCC
jgi:hypothetical protein